MSDISSEKNPAETLSSSRSLLTLSWQSVVYGTGIMGRQLVVYLTLPLFTNLMSQTEYGIVVVSLSVLGLVNTVTNMGLPAALFRLHAGSDDKTERSAIISSSLVLFSMFALAPAVIIIAAAPFVSRTLFDSPLYVDTVLLIAGLLVVETLINFGYVLLRLGQRPTAVSAHSIFLIVSQTTLGLWLVWRVSDASHYFLGQLLGSSVGLLIMAWLTRRNLSWQPSRSATRDLLSFGIPLFPAALATWALHSADKTLVGMLVGIEQAAIYGIGSKIGLLVALGTAPFNAAWPPFAFSIMKRQNAAHIYRDTLTAVAALYVFLGLIVTALQEEIVGILAPAAYAGASVVVPWVAFGQVMWGLYPILSLSLKIVKNTRRLAIVTVLTALLTLGLTVLLIPVLGIRGAAIMSFVGYFALAVLTYLAGQSSFNIPLDWVRLVKLMIAMVLTLGVLQVLLHSSNAQLSLPLRLAALLIYPLTLLATQFLDWSQIRSITRLGWGLLGQRLKPTRPRL